MTTFYRSSLLLVVALAGCAAMSGCYGCGAKQNPDQLREKTAQTTAALKQDARAVAQGVREGWSRDKPLDLNSATTKQLESLPGITAEQANRIIENRPYNSASDLVRKRVLSRADYEKIADRITARK